MRLNCDATSLSVTHLSISVPGLKILKLGIFNEYLYRRLSVAYDFDIITVKSWSNQPSLGTKDQSSDGVEGEQDDDDDDDGDENDLAVRVSEQLSQAFGTSWTFL